MEMFNRVWRYGHVIFAFSVHQRYVSTWPLTLNTYGVHVHTHTHINYINTYRHITKITHTHIQSHTYKRARTHIRTHRQSANKCLRIIELHISFPIKLLFFTFPRGAKVFFLMIAIDANNIITALGRSKTHVIGHLHR